MSDPFNWPFPQRKDLMSLSKINQRDIGHLVRTKQHNEGKSLTTQDISGTNFIPLKSNRRLLTIKNPS